MVVPAACGDPGGPAAGSGSAMPEDTAPRTARELRLARAGRRKSSVQSARATRSARACASSGCRIPPRSSCSARPAISPIGRSSRRSTSSGARTCCRTSSRSSRSAAGRTRTRRSGPSCGPRSSSSAGSCRSRRRPGRSSPRGSRTASGDFDDAGLYDELVTASSTSSTGAGHAREPALLPRHPAVGVRRDHRRARPGRPRPRAARRRLAADRRREAVRARPRRPRIRLNREVGKVFRESQVYRIDHYLGKETVRNILVFRFGNGIFEPIWHRRYVDHVQITVAESIGVEKRGAFYEETGDVARLPAEPPACSCCRSWRWSRRRPSTPTPCATRRSRCCARSSR